MTTQSVSSTNPTPPRPTVVAPDSVANKEVFLQLLVTQIRHQNPLNPADPNDFLAQLSQFTGVEQMLAMRQELGDIKNLLAAQAAARTES